MKRYRGQHIGLLAPLVINRKGVYTELADWARPRGYTHLRVDGDFLPTTGFPRIDRFKEHTHRTAGVRPRRDAGQRDRCCARSSPQALEHGKGVLHVLAPLDGLRGAMMAGAPHRHIGKRAGVLHPARLPGLQHQLRGTRPAPVLLQQQARLVPRLRGHRRQAHARAAQGLRRHGHGRRPARAASRPSPSRRSKTWPMTSARPARARRLNRRRAPCKFDKTGIAEIAALSVVDVRALDREPAGQGRAEHARGGHRARPDPRDPEPPGIPGGSRPGLPHAGPRRAHALGRRGAAHPAGGAARLATCRACATCWTSRPSACMRATTRSCSMRCTSSATRATRWWWWSTTRTRSAAPTTSSTSVPSAGKRGGRVVAQGRSADISAAADSRDRTLPAARHEASGEAAARRWPTPEPGAHGLAHGARRRPAQPARRRRRRAAAAAWSW